MIDERDRLERAARQFTPEPGIVDRVHERRRRKQRNRRIGSAVVALGVCTAAAVVVIASAAHGPAPTPVGTGPAPTSSARPPVLTHNGPVDLYGLPFGVRTFGANGLGDVLVSCRNLCTTVSSAAWSSDGTRLAYSASCAGGCGSAGDPGHGIHVLDVASGTDRLVLRGEIGPLAWSPEGSRIAYVMRGHMTPDGWVWNTDSSSSLMVMNADGSGPVEVWHGRPPVAPGDSLSWSPDGTRLAFEAGGRIYVLALDGSDPVEIASGRQAAWSPDGRRIAYVRGCDLRTVTPHGGSDVRLFDLGTARPGAAICTESGGLVWSPDGTELAVGAPHGVFIVAADGSDAHLLGLWPPQGGAEGITWQPVP